MKRHARFCPRRNFFVDIEEPLDRARLIAALSSSRSRERSKGMSRFDSRNARYASADINERRGKRNFRAFQNVNRKRTYRTENSRVSRSVLPFLFLSRRRATGTRLAIRGIDRSVNVARFRSFPLTAARRLSSPRLLSRQTRVTRPASSRFVKHLYGTIKATSFLSQRDGTTRARYVHIDTYRQLYAFFPVSYPPPSPSSFCHPRSFPRRNTYS